MTKVEPFYRLFGARVAVARDARGLTQAELAKLLTPPVTRASLSNLEAGKQRVNLHTALQLARILKMRMLFP